MPFECLSKNFFFFGLQNQSRNLQDLGLVVPLVKNLHVIRKTLVTAPSGFEDSLEKGQTLTPGLWARIPWPI